MRTRKKDPKKGLERTEVFSAPSFLLLGTPVTFMIYQNRISLWRVRLLRLRRKKRTDLQRPCSPTIGHDARKDRIISDSMNAITFSLCYLNDAVHPANTIQ